MSWEAVTWASKQRMKKPHEQLILLVLANCADPNGVAFAEWPGKEHWWKYLVDRTRLPRSSLFRHINTLVNLNLCTRSMIVLADGARRPVVRLDLTAAFDFERDNDKYEALHSQIADQSQGETESDDDAQDAETDNVANTLQPEMASSEHESHPETGPSGGNESGVAIPMERTRPFPIVGMHKDSSNLDSNYSPLPPSGGTSMSDDGFEDFRKAWLRPIEKLSIARAVWAKIPTVKRGEATAAARGYFAYLATLRKPAVLSAQSFLRDIAGWPQWLRYAPDGDVPLASSMFAAESPEGKAIVVLYEIAAKADFVRQVMMRGGAISYARSVTPRLLALAQAGPKDSWPVLDHRQAASWEHLLREAVTVQVRKHLRAGDRAPWPWPPSIDGKLYTDSTGPPESLMTDDDYAALK